MQPDSMQSSAAQDEAPVYAAPQNKKPAPYALSRADWIFAGEAAVVSLLLVCAGVWGGFRAGFTASYVLLFFSCTLYLRTRGRSAGVFPTVCGVLAPALSAVCFVTSGTLVRFFALILIVVLSAVWFCALSGKPILPGELGLATRVLRQAGHTISCMPRSVRSLSATENRRVKTASKILLGLLCASPVLCAVIALLIRSDAAFEGLMQHLFCDAGNTAAQIVVAACGFPFLLSFGFSAKKEPDAPQRNKSYAGMDTAFLAAFVGVLAVCYLVYLFSQLAYFFSAFSGILPADYTFSFAEYARRGFFELCAIAGINLVVLYLMLLLSKKEDDKLPAILRALGVFTLVFTLLLIATAIAKMALYIRAYGVTVLRIGTSAFMAFMAVVFLAMLLRFFLPRVRVLPVAVVAASVVVLVLGVGNIHAFAAGYNYTAYESGKLDTIDVAYLRKLGDEGVPYLLRLTECDDEKVRRLACGEVCLAVEERYDGIYEEIDNAAEDVIEYYLIPQSKNAGGLSQFSIPRRKAYDALDGLLQTQPDFLRAHIRERTEAADIDGFLWF